MANNPLNALRTVRGLAGQYEEGMGDPIQGSGLTPINIQGGDADAAQGLNYTRQILDELEQHRAANAAGTTAAAPALMKQYQSDIADSPVTKQAGDVQNFMTKLRDANLHGFADPQEQAGYQQQQTEKNSPSSLENIKGMFGVQEKKIEGQTQKDIWSGRTAAYNERTSAYRAKAASDAAAKIKAASMHNPQIAAIAKQAQEDADKIHLGIITGRIKEDDPNVVSTLNSLEQWINQATQGLTPATGNVHPDAASLAKSLMQAHPGASLADLMTAAGPAARPEAQEMLRQALLSLGAK